MLNRVYSSFIGEPNTVWIYFDYSLSILSWGIESEPRKEVLMTKLDRQDDGLLFIFRTPSLCGNLYIQLMLSLSIPSQRIPSTCGRRHTDQLIGVISHMSTRCNYASTPHQLASIRTAEILMVIRHHHR